MWGSFCHLRGHRAKPNSVCGLFPPEPNQLPLAAAQGEARSRKLGSDLLGRVQGVSPKGLRRFPGLCGQLLDEDQKRLPGPARRGPRLGCIPGRPTGCVKRVRPYRCPQQDHPHTLFPRKTPSVHSRPVGPSKIRPRWLGGCYGEGRWCRGKG